MRLRSFPFIAVSLVATLAWLDPVPAGAAEPDATRARMQQIFDSMRVLLPLSVNESAFASPANRERVTHALEKLAQNAEALSAHARRDDVGRKYLGSSLEADARRALARYREGRPENAAFLVRRTTDYCVACHTQAESPDSSLTTGFVDATALAALPLPERARILVATRQFDEGQAAFEELLLDPNVRAQDLTGALSDYLVVTIRVKGDYARARSTLEKFQKRPDLWERLREDVGLWIDALRRLEPERDAPPSVETARRRIDEARAIVPYPADRGGLVHYVVASGLLLRLLEAPPASTPEEAEAWYLLGVAESETTTGSWASQGDLYLETAIRTAPQSPSAKKAYSMLEENILLDWSGSSGTHLPKEERDRLAELRALIDAR